MNDGPPSRKRIKSTHISKLLKLKVKCDLSTKQLQQVLDVYHPNESKFVNKLLRQELRTKKTTKGIVFHRLHGCSVCGDFMWTDDEDIPCSVCGNQDGRYDHNGDPFEEVWVRFRFRFRFSFSKVRVRLGLGLAGLGLGLLPNPLCLNPDLGLLFSATTTSRVHVQRRKLAKSSRVSGQTAS